jgi:hypothetical protein
MTSVAHGAISHQRANREAYARRSRSADISRRSRLADRARPDSRPRSDLLQTPVMLSRSRRAPGRNWWRWPRSRRDTRDLVGPPHRRSRRHDHAQRGQPDECRPAVAVALRLLSGINFRRVHAGLGRRTLESHDVAVRPSEAMS